jgi:hypothetical protein
MAYALLLASLCTGLLAFRVHAGFERPRLLVVTSSQLAIEPSIDVPLPSLEPLSGAPAALIIRVRGAAEPLHLSVTVGNETLVADVPVPPERRTRVDASFTPVGLVEHRVTISGDRPGWHLESLEVSNAHGFSRGVLNFVIVPASRAHDGVVPRWLLVPVLLGLLALRPSLDWPHRGGRLLHCCLVAIVFLLFGTVLLAPLVTPYNVLLSLGSFLFCAAILYAHAVVSLVRALVPDATRQSRTGLLARRYLPHAVIAILVLWSVARFHEPGIGFTRLIMFGKQFQPQALRVVQETPRAVDSEWGYDGQFYAQLALEPFLRSDEIRTAIDSPSYRGRRILFSWIAYMAGAGRPWLVIQAYALLNVAFWVLLACLLFRWLPAGTSRLTAAWAGCMLAEGLLSSVRLALLDGPSMLLLALGIVAVERNRPWIAAGVLGGAGLGRETNLLGGAIVVDTREIDVGSLSRLAGMALVAVGPLALWMVYLSSMAFSEGADIRDFVPSLTGSGAFAPPFAGYAGRWVDIVDGLRADGWDSPARQGLLTHVALTTQALVLVWRRDPRNPWWRVGVAYLGLMLVLGGAVWEGDVAAASRIVLPMTIAFNILLPGGRWFWPLWIVGNVHMLNGFRVIEMPGLWELV